MGDPRREYVRNAIVDALGPPSDREWLLQATNECEHAITAFLEDAAVDLLACSIHGTPSGQRRLLISNVADFSQSCDFQLLLTKLKAGPLTLEDIPRRLSITSVSGSCISSLYHTLKNVYNPLLAPSDAGQHSEADSHLQGLLMQLEAGLGSSLRQGQQIKDYAAELIEPNHAPLSAILRPDDEVQLWSGLAASSTCPAPLKQRAAAISAIFVPISPKLVALRKNTGEIPTEEVLDLIDELHQILEALWELQDAAAPGGFAWGQRRMQHFMKLFAMTLAGVLQNQFNSTFWQMPFRYEDQFFEGLCERLDDVMAMRETHAELLELLVKDSMDHVAAAQVFEPFQGLNPFHISSYANPAWLVAKTAFEARMVPIEQRISQQLHEVLNTTILPALTAAVAQHADRASTAAIQPSQVFKSLKRYAGLLSRPAVAAALQKELQALVQQIDLYLDNIQAEFEHRAQTCQAVSKDLLKEVQAWKQMRFTEWSRATMDRLQDIKMDQSGKLMDMDSSDGRIKLHYNEELVVLLREVRQLQSTGFAVQRDILAEVDTANTFYRHGLLLKQVVNFYNNSSTEIIPCQKPMLLQYARDFESVLLNPKDGMGKPITWGNSAALEGYVRRLQQVAEQLKQKNRVLKTWHKVAGDKVIALMSLDLVSAKSKWAAGIKEMREFFIRVEQDGFSMQSQNVWRLHWDHQIYKALSYQYQCSLESINDNLPQMEISLVVKQGRLQYEPPLEEVHSAHYKNHLKPLLAIPLNFKNLFRCQPARAQARAGRQHYDLQMRLLLQGVSEASERPGFFKRIMEANVPGISKAYAAAEALFEQLQMEPAKWAGWLVAGSDEMAKLVEEQHETADWEDNFKALKAAARDAEKLPNDVQLGCYTVCTHPVKGAIERQMKDLREEMLASLRRKALTEKDEVEAFVADAQTTLGNAATSIEEIGSARQAAKALVAALPHIMDCRRRVDDKNRLLKAMAAAGNLTNAGQAVDMTEVDNAWDSFTSQLQQHDTHLDEQKNQLQGQLARQAGELKSRISGFGAHWQEVKPHGMPSGDPALMLLKMEDYSKQLADLQEEARQMAADCAHFSMEDPDFSQLNAISDDISATRTAWSRFSEFMAERASLAKCDWLSVRDELWRIEDFLNKWSKDTAGQLSKDPVAVILAKEVDSYRRCLPYLKFVRGTGWERKHWTQLFAMLKLVTKGPDAVTFENLSLAHFLDKADQLAACAEKVKALNAQALGESVIRKALEELQVWGLECRFSLYQYSSTAGTKSCPLVKEWREVMTEVGDHQSLVASLKQAAYFHLFKDEAGVWEQRLAVLAEGLQTLNTIQRKWVYLEPIFARGALPNEQPRFRRVAVNDCALSLSIIVVIGVDAWMVDDQLRQLLSGIEADPMVIHFADIPRIMETLQQMLQQLDICQKALSNFLEDKRSAFPRFYFIGDDDLLEILGQAKDPAVIQTHLKKLFAGVHGVTLTDSKDAITAALSVESEQVQLATAVPVSEQVESWLQSLLSVMQTTLQGLLTSCMQHTDFKSMPSQVICLAGSIKFTQQAEQAIQQQQLKTLQADLQQQLAEYTAADWEGYRVMQLKIQALVLDVIHHLDVVETLIRDGTSSPEDWAWVKQLRYYKAGRAGGDATVLVKMADAALAYSWEYQGNAPKLVYTPLTDRCYLTITQGITLGYGGNPYGPAGTGKTESVKALGQALARQVLVFNCDGEFDFRSVGRILIGLVKCGAWGCFDEFNRLEEDVLSAVSQQIQLIQGAIKARQPSVELMGRTVNVDCDAGIFVTMNPAGKGYGGRSKLPDNLKALFRSVAMTLPDNEIIAEVLLLSSGFATAKELGRKLVALFGLAQQLLSRQQHYDWGLRALKTCLAISGRLLREHRAAGRQLNQVSETQIIIRGVRLATMPKLTFDDTNRYLQKPASSMLAAACQQFQALLDNVFPGVTTPEATNEDMRTAIHSAAATLQLQVVPEQVEKVLQLHLGCAQRIGVIIVGPPGSGKSTTWRLLQAALSSLGCPPVLHVVNPKAISRHHLLGHTDADTREWTDGVLTAAARLVAKQPLDQRSWIVCDGDVDPEWIESLNSVLDDNKLLTMPSGERIQFANNVNFIFECHSLQYASPATVSRCGMLLMSYQHNDIQNVLAVWLSAQPIDQNGLLQQWLQSAFLPALEYAQSQSQAVDMPVVSVVRNALSHLVGLGTKHDLACGLFHGLGANLDEAGRHKLAAEIGRLTGEPNVLVSAAAADPSALLRGEGWGSFGDMHEAEGNSQLVMTEAVRAVMLGLVPWLRAGLPVLLVGPEGCGKAQLLQHCFQQLPAAVVATVSCSAQTTAANIIQKLEQMCGKPVSTNTGRVLRPKASGNLVLFLRDINLPKADKYGTSQVMAFLQQLLTYKGFYSKLEFVGVERIQVVCSMNPATTVGRHPLAPRLAALLHVACMSYPPPAQLQTILSTLLTGTLDKARLDCWDACRQGTVNGLDPSWNSQATADKLAAWLLDLYAALQAAFPPSRQSHYSLTPRHLSVWAAELQRYSLHGTNLLQAAAYEACRVFRDRLVHSDHTARFDSILGDTLQKHWRGKIDMASSVFATIGSPALQGKAGTSQLQLSNWSSADYLQLVTEKLTAFEREHRDLGIVLFSQALEGIAQLDRVLSNFGGSALLCGHAGVGRKSSLALVAYMHHMEVWSPSMPRGYNLQSFHSDLKALMLKAGVEGQPICLFLEDHQLVDPGFLECINSLLTGGEVHGLFSNEELDSTLAPLKDTVASQAVMGQSLYSFFTSQVQQKLRIVISMDPASPDFHLRCQANPALISRCYIQWTGRWDNAGMEAVAISKLQPIMEAAGKDSLDLRKLIQQLLAVHNSRGSAGATPRHYVAFVNLCGSMYSSKRSQLLEQQDFLKGGLNKLAGAAANVDTLSKEAQHQRVQLKASQVQAEQALQSITAAMEQASGHRQEAAVLKNQLAADQVSINSRKGDVESELAVVAPIIEAARLAVGQIKSDHLNEIRSLKAPPDAIRDVLEGMLKLMGQADTSWNSMKKFLGNRGIKNEIIGYDAHRITPEMRSAVNRLLAQKGASFEQANIYRVSQAAAPLAAWVTANLQYADVLQKVAPLEQELGGLTANFTDSQERIAACEAQLQQLDEQVVSLKAEFESKKGLEIELKSSLARAEATLNAATALLGKLAGEKSRWEAQVANFTQVLQELPSNSLLAAAFVTYLGREPEDGRQAAVAQWCSTLGRPSAWSLTGFLSSETELLTWKAEGVQLQ
ncbi:hypothetical protein ABBQ38_000251 [Trebouxia sp. C0009 RCD-2024]